MAVILNVPSDHYCIHCVLDFASPDVVNPTFDVLTVYRSTSL